MSLLGAMSTAISGLNAQSAAFSNISDDVANSQTVGFRGVATNFIDYLTQSNAFENQSGNVATTPQYENELQGSVQQSSNPLALAIDGQGFFAVSQTTGTNSAGNPEFSPLTNYTRAGDFTLDAQGYLVNSAGGYLNGWAVDQATGSVNSGMLSPIQVSQTQFTPVPTSQVSLIANVPSTPSANSNLSSTVDIYDATGASHQLDMTWVQNATNDWTLNLSSPDNTGGASIGSVEMLFNANGTLASLENGTGSVAISGTGSTAAITLSPQFNGVTQNITMNLGTFGGTSGITQFAGTDYQLSSLTQNGAAPGSFTGISITSAGQVQANYNNGQNVTIAEVPVITFENSDALQRQDGQMFTATLNSGVPIAQNQNQNGAGSLVTGSVEQSNVDIATQLSNLIVAQQAYGANAKVITAANQLLQTTLQMIQG
jgi:flagellar hook protein FlgE